MADMLPTSLVDQPTGPFHEPIRGVVPFVLSLFLVFAGSALQAQSLSPISDIAKLSVGRAHACALSNAGGVKCWGSNFRGQLGNNSNTNSDVPVPVTGLAFGVVDISAGREHTCAVTVGGGVKCWGRNFLGQLGDGTTTNRPEPVDVSGLSEGVAEVSAGSAHTCALEVDGDLHCWGFNGEGQLGIGSQDNQTVPAQVSGGRNISAVTTGQSNACWIDNQGGVACWGVYDRDCSLFGCGFAFFRRPEPVDGLRSGVTSLSSGEYFNCAVTSDSAVKCWGDNFDGQLNSSGEDNPDPFVLFDIGGLESGVDSVSAGMDHACAVLSDGSVRCWGSNRVGRLGDGSTEYRFPPVPVSGLSDVTQVSAGGSSSCALTQGGSAVCWGNNTSGQLGNNDPWFRRTPVSVPGLGSGVAAIASGAQHSCAVLNSGAVRCWGTNSLGQLGNGSVERQAVPASVTGLASGVVDISAGQSHTCVVTQAGAALCWGDNEFGQLGDNSSTGRLVPVAVQTLNNGVSQIASGSFHTCARTTAGGAKCWGRNIESQLGDASLADQNAPVEVIGLAQGVTAIAAGGAHSCAIDSGGGVQCWGDNDSGQIGNGTTDQVFTPFALMFPNQDVSHITSGNAHSCAVASGGEALCWGDNEDGQVGTGFFNSLHLDPIRVQGMSSGVAEIDTGERHTCAINSAGGVMCWGDNFGGQLGDGTTTLRRTPVAVTGLASGVAQISAGSSHTCALTSAGGVNCWGNNSSDQLGVGRKDTRVPGPVLDDPSFFRSGFEGNDAP